MSLYQLRFLQSSLLSLLLLNIFIKTFYEMCKKCGFGQKLEYWHSDWKVGNQKYKLDVSNAFIFLAHMVHQFTLYCILSVENKDTKKETFAKKIIKNKFHFNQVLALIVRAYTHVWVRVCDEWERERVCVCECAYVCLWVCVCECVCVCVIVCVRECVCLML